MIRLLSRNTQPFVVDFAGRNQQQESKHQVNEPVVLISLPVETTVNAESCQFPDPVIIRCIGIDPACSDHMKDHKQKDQYKGFVTQVVINGDVHEENTHQQGGRMLQIHFPRINGMNAGKNQNQTIKY